MSFGGCGGKNNGTVEIKRSLPSLDQGPVRGAAVRDNERRGGGMETGRVGGRYHREEKLPSCIKRNRLNRAHPSRSPLGGGGGGIRQRHHGTAVAILHPAPETLRHVAAARARCSPGYCVYRILTQTSVRARS